MEVQPAGARTPARRRRWLGSLIALVVALAVGGLAYWLTHRPPETAAGARPGGGPGGPGGPGGFGGGRGAPATTVGIAPAEKADIPVLLEALGTVTSPVTVTVRAQVGGTLKQVLFREGQTVKAGEVLAVIDPEPFRMALMQAQGQRMRDEAQLENARLTLQRYQTLLQQDSIARQDVDTQAATVKQLEGTVVSDRAAEGTARLNLGYSRIVAPASGRIGLRQVDAGNVVGTGDTNGIAVITQLTPIDVEFAVPQDRVPDVERAARAGQKLPATALDRTRTQVLDSGSFSTLDNQVDTTTGTVRAKARFANAEGTLFPSQFVNIRLQIDTLRDAVVVPVTALRHGPNGDFVYVLNPDRTVSLRNVTRGLASVDKVAVTSGLQVGERVITEGGDRLKDGARVQLPGDRPAGAARGASAPNAASGASGAGWSGRGDRASGPHGASWPDDGASRPRHRRPASDATS